MTRLPSAWPKVDFETVQPPEPPGARPWLRASTLSPDGKPLAVQADLKQYDEERARAMLMEFLRRAAEPHVRVAPASGEDVHRRTT